MIDEAAFEAAAQLVHTNYSDKPWEGREAYADRIWARGTLKAAIHELGLEDTVEDAIQGRKAAEDALAEQKLLAEGFRAQSLRQGEALSRIWATVGQDGALGFGRTPEFVTSAVESKLAEVQQPPQEIEWTDNLVNEVALGYWGPSVVYDREKLRSALANALQTR